MQSRLQTDVQSFVCFSLSILYLPFILNSWHCKPLSLFKRQRFSVKPNFGSFQIVRNGLGSKKVRSPYYTTEDPSVLLRIFDAETLDHVGDVGDVGDVLDRLLPLVDDDKRKKKEEEEKEKGEEKEVEEEVAEEKKGVEKEEEEKKEEEEEEQEEEEEENVEPEEKKEGEEEKKKEEEEEEKKEDKEEEMNFASQRLRLETFQNDHFFNSCLFPKTIKQSSLCPKN